MSDALLDQWHQVGASITRALGEATEKRVAQEERLRGIEGGLRLELGALSTEIRTERLIGTNEREALHLRIDRLEATLERGFAVVGAQLQSIATLLGTNGSGGHG